MFLIRSLDRIPDTTTPNYSSYDIIAAKPEFKEVEYILLDLCCTMCLYVLYMQPLWKANLVPIMTMMGLCMWAAMMDLSRKEMREMTNGIVLPIRLIEIHTHTHKHAHAHIKWSRNICQTPDQWFS